VFLEAIEYCNGNVAQAAVGNWKNHPLQKVAGMANPYQTHNKITVFNDQKFGKASKLEFLEIRCLKDIGFLPNIFQKREIIP